MAPRADLGYAANYLYMLTGRGARARSAPGAIEQYLILDDRPRLQRLDVHRPGHRLDRGRHGRLRDRRARRALSGPLHGGAPSRALDTLDAIGTPDRIDAWITEQV